ncbi:DNA topoisomerase III [Klebsiella michiganensis]|uniref:DNA topoisomerase III n=1 Tax=Klebsiella michiganensis TaxID=1134687 RepID=UPI0015E50419|nr:DNA topoisomerase III [Klebsiella michiganensis]MBA8306134.1 DNA topoisomerase III [Klebsiella michiganensis]MBW5931926.1 DNA topoisomerase III [Klebsiella michiganensis]QLP35698.1 DNA topoisomerase III [Klebsiella michiganensis]WFX49336.1 DNA topoisomerase III [Klebsiella michiganensis]WFX54996.1 DNA topoisomerase III [Klebsiella michiganensis]
MKLFLCEKPSQGRDIARILGTTQRGDGCLIGKDIIVTWGFGHLMEAESPEGYDLKYKKWVLTDLPIIPEQWKNIVKPATKKQFTIIQKLLKKASSVVIATDADREGEMIAREILDACKFRGPVSRLWLSALDDASIRKALASLKPGEATESLYQAGLGRARADWLCGMNLTRLYTLKGRKPGQKGGVFSVGRVQTPTLNLIVHRDQQIASFIPRDYWTLTVALTGQNTPFQAQWLTPEAICDEEGRCINQSLLQQAATDIGRTRQARIISTETKRIKESAPLPFDLGTLQQVCSKKWGMGAQQLLDIAQSLYETHKATTYPRTDCGYLPLSMQAEVSQVFSALQQTDPALKPLLAQCNIQQKSRVWDDKKITAHHAIIPTTQPADISKMSEDERRVYDLIRRHYLAQFLPLYEADKTQMRLECAGHTLAAAGNVVVTPGWKTLFSEDTDETDEKQLLPQLAENTQCTVTGANVRAQKTRPPGHYTEGTLIAAMKNASRFVADERLKQRLKESAGLGTEATRAGIIETLLKRGYIRKEKRYLIATDNAVTLMAMLPDIVKDPGMTALWEQALDDIAAGKLSLAVFLQKQSLWIATIVEQAR